MANAKQIDFLLAGVLDANGVPLALGLIYTYEAGISTPKTTYTAADKSANATNPIVLDSYGKATIYAEGNYKFIIKTAAGVTVATLDNLYYSVPESTNKPTRSISTDYNVTTADYLIIVNTASGNIILNLPTAIGNSGIGFVVIKISADANIVTIYPYGTQTIGGSATQTITTQNQALGFMSDNSNYQLTQNPGTATLTGTETLTNKTLPDAILSGPIMSVPQIQDTSSDHQYIVAVNELAADRIVTMPLLLAADEFVFKNHAVVLTNKDLSSATNTITTTNHISGLQLSNGTDTEHDLNIAAGKARDDTDAVSIVLASAITKQFDAAWEVGTAKGGMMNSETIPADGTLLVWLIKRSDTGVVDVGGTNYATSGLIPVLPTNYDYHRLIGMYRTASSHILNGTWWGTSNERKFRFTTPILSISATNPGTSAVTAALTVPTGLILEVDMQVSLRNSTGGEGPFYLLVSSLDSTDITPGVDNRTISVGSGETNQSGRIKEFTNTSNSVRYRLAGGTSNTTVYIKVYGWAQSL